jgi:uncharacterized protein YyaL (SSP411 family)
MNNHLLRRLAWPALCTGLILGLGACRKAPPDEAVESKVPIKVVPELLRNQLGPLPGALSESQSLSPIRWQPWTEESFSRAKESNRLVFAVIGLPQNPNSFKSLQALASDERLVQTINSDYVPILVDGDASREMSILSADLCMEINQPLNMPLFLWMTHQGNPVAWIPAAKADDDSLYDLFNQSHLMVSQMWGDSPEYILKNSSLDNANRRERLQSRKNVKVMSREPALDTLRALRQLASLYDPYSRTFDETGGLFPSSSLELLSAAAVHPGLPDEIKTRCLETMRELLVDILPSAMFDPLDGGVFSSKNGPTWALPSFARDCVSQARVAVALLEAHRATGNTRALEQALALIAYAEKSHQTPDGLFFLGLSREVEPEAWMWSVEEVRKLLSPQDAEMWIQATGMRDLGNLPSEIDPQRRFFRANTVGLLKSISEMAADAGQPLADFTARFDAVRNKLIDARASRSAKVVNEEIAHAPSTLRMVSAYAAAFASTGDASYRQKAVKLLGQAREAYSDGPRLRSFPREAPAAVGAGRAFLYALTIQSALDVAAITSDEPWLVWAEDLATTAAELFTANDFLKECPDEAKLVDLPVTDLVMLFDDSTAGLVSMGECRLAEIGRPMVESFSNLATPMPTYVLERPVLHTDLLLAAIARHYRVTALYGADLPAGMKLAVERLPLRMVQRRKAKPDEQVPAGAVKILLGTEPRSILASTPEDLQRAILHSGEKSANLPADEK